MSKIRIAQRGWNGTVPATTAEEVKAGVDLMWVEIGGHRIGDDEGLIAVTVRAASSNITKPIIEIAVGTPVELVYLDAQGNELGPIRVVDPSKYHPEQFQYGTERPLDDDADTPAGQAFTKVLNEAGHPPDDASRLMRALADYGYAIERTDL